MKKEKSEKKWFKTFSSFGLFIFLVIIPWLFVIFYVMFIAQPRYTSTSEVVVKQVSDTKVSANGGFAALLGVNNTSSEDASYLTQFIMSNDMVKRLDTKFDFRNAYHIDGKDFIYELPEDASQEELLEYFKKRVHIDLDEQTKVLSVTTEGFDADYTLELNKAILGLSEQFINQISNKIAVEQLQYAKKQLDESKKDLDAKKSWMLQYQNKNQIFDPQANAAMVNQLIGNLQAQLASLRTEQRQKRSYLNDNAPELVSIASQIAAVETQIREERAKLTSNSNAKLSQQTIQFETIKSEVEFAAEMYKVALSSYEQAKLEAFRKMKNLVVISAPYKAEQALYPRKAYIIGTSLALLLIMYGFVRLVMAVIKDHSN
ncbi:MAG: capsule biosynthesis protein [Gammaproteobacteria bacterium]|nr:MAG: capsule biosynthesis protein [Gammaproteobacteria bacterium]